MKHLNNQRGNGMVYILWIMVVSIAICVIVLNIAKVYAVKQQAANATQLAALAGTSVLVKAVNEGIKEFDILSEDEDVLLQRALQRENDDEKSIEDLIKDKAEVYKNQGLAKDIAYINAMNDILPSRMASYNLLKGLINSQVGSVQYTFIQTVRDVVKKNGGNEEGIEIIFNTEFQVEVKANLTYESITDTAEQYISKMTEEVPQIGKGPTLKFVGGG